MATRISFAATSAMALEMAYDWREVSEDEFIAALKAYGEEKITKHLVTIREPPLLEFYDHSLAPNEEYPYTKSWIAMVDQDWLGPDGEVDREGHRRFWKHKLRADLFPATPAQQRRRR